MSPIRSPHRPHLTRHPLASGPASSGAPSFGPPSPPSPGPPPRPPRRAAALVLLAGLGAPVAAQDNEECLSCHEVEGLVMQRDGRAVNLSVDPERYEDGVHSALDCIACHADLDGTEEYPHARDLERVDCTMCHDDDDGPVAAWRDSTHGKEAAAGNPLAPLCQDCHGDHYILPLDHPDSAIAPFNVPLMCVQCHAEGSEVERVYDLPQEQVFQRYRQSIHGEGLFEQGLTVTAVCTSCHNGHLVLPHTDPASSIHKDNVVGTCMQCHGKIEEVHGKSIAGELWEKAGVVPICVECHSPHEIRKVDYDTNMRNADCMSCHADPISASSDGRSLQVDLAEHELSIHGRNQIGCARCHAEVTPSHERPCSTITGPVECAACHETEVQHYRAGIHGRLFRAEDPNAPYCTDCHGTHGMLEQAAPEDAPADLRALVRSGPTHRRNVPDLCARCHREGAPAAERRIGEEGHIVEHYSMSIHGKGLFESGLIVTAICTDCHTTHRELPARDPASSVHESNIAQTCGECHEGIFEQFRRSIHSAEANPDFVADGDVSRLPACDDCHPPHTVARTDHADFRLGIMQQCGHCHADITETYFDTYHGKASALGDTTKAKCYDCHGAHDILPEDDPHSHISTANIVGTCAKCHEGAHEQFAGYLTHATHHDRERYPALFWAFWGMTGLLAGTFVFFGLHIVAWLPRSWQMRRAHRAHGAAAPPKRYYRRFTPFERGLHLTMVLSFFGLVITGMMLKFSSTRWAQVLADLMGGPVGAGLIHRFCGIVTFGYLGAHIWDVLRKYRRSGKTAREYFFGPDSILPRLSDVRELRQTLRWFFGRGPMPRFGRWTYWEKFDYFAVFWGVTIIGTTGLILWFPVTFTHVLPGWALNVATIIHSDEALLATGFIFTIHFFNTQLRPDKFPQDTVVFTGRMPVEELKRERPALYDRLVESGELEQELIEPASPGLQTAAKIFAFCALLVGLTLVITIAWTMLVG